MKKEILKIIEEKHIKSAGHNGVSLITISNQLDYDLQEIKKALNELYTENLITTYAGIHGKMIKLKK